MKAKPPFLCLEPGFDLALGKVLLTGVGTAPSSENYMYFQYKKLSVLNEVEKCFRKMKYQGTGKTCIFFNNSYNSYISKYVLEGKHPPSTWCTCNHLFNPFAQK